MSRRYGRKQRRVAREQITEMAGMLSLTHGALTRERIANKTLRDRLSDIAMVIEHWDREIRYLLGPYSSFAIDDTTFRIDHPDEIRQMPVLPETTVRFDQDMVAAPESLSYYVETMLRFVTDLDESDRLTLRRYLFMRLKIGTDRTGYTEGYAMSESYWNAIRQAPPEDLRRLAQRITHEMLTHLATANKQKRKTA